MTVSELKNLINGDKTKLKIWFEDFDKHSKSINDWQNLLGYPLETYGCQICHKIRNHIMSGLSYLFGVDHLSGSKFPGLAKHEFEQAIQYAEQGEIIRLELIPVYRKISKLLYP